MCIKYHKHRNYFRFCEITSLSYSFLQKTLVYRWYKKIHEGESKHLEDLFEK